MVPRGRWGLPPGRRQERPSYQAVLQSGTAVLVDDHGVPRVRCACGNPLTPPVAQRTTRRRTGDSRPSYHPSNVVVVEPPAPESSPATSPAL